VLYNATYPGIGVGERQTWGASPMFIGMWVF
jgi:hypothetical protein